MKILLWACAASAALFAASFVLPLPWWFILAPVIVAVILTLTILSILLVALLLILCAIGAGLVSADSIKIQKDFR